MNERWVSGGRKIGGGGGGLRPARGDLKISEMGGNDTLCSIL